LTVLISILNAASALESRVDARLAVAGLSLPKLAALRVLVAADDALPLGQLAGRLACVKSNVTQLVERLEADGFAVRALDPTDRRSRLAAVTDAGRSAYEEGVRILRAAERDLLDVLTPEELGELTRLIRKLDPRCG
jgi:DNA-binding MarR family transcriptional regulator